MRTVKCFGCFLLIFLVGGCSVFGFTNLFSKPINFEIDSTKPVTLDFGNSEVKVMKWSKDYVQVTPNEFTKQSVDIENKDNIIKFDYEKYVKKFPKAKMPGFHINVPKNLPAAVKAENIRARECTVSLINGSSANVRECSTPDEFIAEGGYIYIREVNFGNDSIIKNTKIEMRDSKFNNISLTTDNIERSINAEIRSTNGTVMVINADDYENLSIVLHHVTLDKLIINSNCEKEDGEIILEGCNITNVENNSRIKVIKKAAL